MSYITFHDVSYAQGQYNMDADPSPIVEMKMSGYYYGSKLPYLDVQAARNYNNAVRLNKVPICYHFAGGADPRQEAEYFINVACSPLADGDIYELDYELNNSMNPPADPDGWCRAFADRVKELTGVYPLFYTYTDLIHQHGFQRTLEVCGLMQANYGVSPDADIPGPPYIVHQYTDTPLDTNALFIPLDTLKKYARGYNAAPQPEPQPVPPPQPVPDPTPVPVPTPQPDPTPDPTPTPTPAPDPLPTPEPTPQPEPAQTSWKKLVAGLLAAAAAVIAGIVAWLHS